MTDAATLRIERAYQAPAQAVFDAWTSEEVLRRWFHAEHDWETTEAEVDLRVGGVVRVVMRDPHKDVEHGGMTPSDSARTSADAAQPPKQGASPPANRAVSRGGRQISARFPE